MLNSCDTMVSLGATSANGQTIFAKNSDRPADECQPLVMRPRTEHPAGTTTHCQFVSLPEAPVTYRHVGSRPYWCWGYEHGFNEHQVVIGNESLPSKLAPASEPRLVGMEIVRLALERAATASEAVNVMTQVIERHGQGKFENDQGVRTYDNLFLIADPHEAFVLEAVGRQWAARQVTGAHGISNVATLGADAERVSDGAAGAAAELGLCDAAPGRPFRFADAFGDRDASASGIARQRRSTALLREREGRIDARTMMRILSDHSDGEQPDEPFVEDIRGSVSICVHREDGGFPGATAASLVADSCADGSRLPVYWCGLSSPCMTRFYPVFLQGDLPRVLAIGGETPAEDSPWWTFRRLARSGVHGGLTRRAEIRAAWRELQGELFESAHEMASRGREMIDSGRSADVSKMLTGYMDSAVSRMLKHGAELLRERA